MHIALYKPDIPQNTAAIVRLCACLNLKLHIIEPCGFNINDSRFKRVAMDYMGYTKIFKYEDYKVFKIKNKKSRIILMTTKAKKNYHTFRFKKDDILLFGRESAGVPKNLHNTIKDKIKIPMNKKARSLNVVVSVAIFASEAIKQNNLFN